nr:AF211540_1 Avr9/Cf-9 rapidly elicited protein 75 [Ipomoea batatas]
MAWSEPESLCKTHPEHKQPAGVCSCCLRERLSKISGAVMDSSAMSISSSPAAANYNYSSASSSCSSGCVSPRGHRRITSDVAGRVDVDVGHFPVLLDGDVVVCLVFKRSLRAFH